MNCKPGDIAMITSPTNYGRLVEVLEWLGVVGVIGADHWRIKTLQTIRVTAGPDAGKELPPGSVMAGRDAHLKPFQPPPEEETTETEKELETT